ncbi:tetratricopeptide repeat protein [Burkholderia contaminans]|uniref:tetratricopeptide repeat protein n=1 Tax=Burkholderia contaminans TaxID=488447 RepID=UPI00241658F7|nr:tetratricopeptide repeat protein [Burkholderia contaminans]WFN13296.1 sel1 repeat family protein [Burkholderia contaminans]
MNELMQILIRVARFAVLTVFCMSVLPVHAGLLDSLQPKINATMSDQPRYEKLPLFNPHRTEFSCVYQAQRVPTPEPQAEMLFQQAVAIDDPNVRNIDYAKMYQLYLQAAERNHWKAMLNLASLILRDDPGVPEHDPEKAIRWVERAMALGAPDAYDRMGVYHLNGVVKGGNASTGYAFFQRAADMGSPAAMTFLGDKMSGTFDDPEGEFWGNLPVATKMLECALAQGYGAAADKLSYIYRGTTPESKSRALLVLHEGVKLGCAECADNLSTEFNGFGLTRGENLIGHIDKARAQRYSKIGDVLKLYDGRLRLPNLDKVLPLPPAPLPKWNGDVQTLINAAKAITPPAKSPKGGMQQGRLFVPDGYAVSALKADALAVGGDQWVPKTGYWLALYGSSTEPDGRLIARSGFPERFEAGERFEPPVHDWLSPDRVQWYFLGEAYRLPPQRTDFLVNLTIAGMLREVAAQPSVLRCSGEDRCPETGVWEGRVADDHPMAILYNRWDQQTFIEIGQAFPAPSERFIDIASNDVQWTYLGSPNLETGAPGTYAVSL